MPSARYTASLHITADASAALRAVDGLQASLNQLDRAGTAGMTLGLRSLTAAEERLKAHQRGAAALNRSLGAMTGIGMYGPGAESVLPSMAPMTLDLHLDRKGEMDLASLGYVTGKWSKAAEEAARTTTRLRQELQRSGGAFAGGTESMQRVAGAALMISGTTGPASQAIRGLASTMLMAGDNAAMLGGILKGGLATAAAVYGINSLVSKYRDLATAAQEANDAAAAIGRPDAGSIGVLDLILDRYGMISAGPAVYTFAPERERMGAEVRRRQATRYAEAMKEKTPVEIVQAEMVAAPGAVWTQRRFAERVREEEARRDRRDATKQALADTKAAARDRERAELQSQQDLFDRLSRARLTGIPDARAQKLWDMGPATWKQAGGGDMIRGMQWLEAALEAQEEATEKAKRAQEEYQSELAAARERATARELASIRENALARISAYEDAARKELAAQERAAAKLVAGAAAHRERANTAWQNLAAGKRADGKTREDSREERRIERENNRMERRARTVLHRLAEGEPTTRRGREIAGAYLERRQADREKDQAERAKRKARTARRGIEHAGEARDQLHDQYRKEDRAAEVRRDQERVEEARRGAVTAGAAAPTPPATPTPAQPQNWPGPTWDTGRGAAILPDMSAPPPAALPSPPTAVQAPQALDLSPMVGVERQQVSELQLQTALLQVLARNLVGIR